MVSDSRTCMHHMSPVWPAVSFFAPAVWEVFSGQPAFKHLHYGETARPAAVPVSVLLAVLLARGLCVVMSVWAPLSRKLSMHASRRQVPLATSCCVSETACLCPDCALYVLPLLFTLQVSSLSASCCRTCVPTSQTTCPATTAYSCSPAGQPTPPTGPLPSALSSFCK